MPVQTTYALNRNSAYEGLIADNQLRNVVSRRAETDIGYGLGVLWGTNDDSTKLPTATFDGKLFLGVTRYTLNHESVGGNHVIPQNFSADVITDGVVWVFCENGCSPNDDVYLIHTSSSGNVGRFRTDANTNKAVKVPGAKWLTTATAGKLAKIKLNIGA